MKPTHKHDCDECKFLGTILELYEVKVDAGTAELLTNGESDRDVSGVFDETRQYWDLYFCAKQGIGLKGTIIARLSSEPSQYKSGMAFHVKDRELGIAFQIAKAKGLFQ